MQSVDKFILKFEKLITAALKLMMAIIVTLSVVELAWLLIRDIFTPPFLLLEISELLELFGLFLLILIGIELLETLTIDVHNREIRTEAIILVALIALARKVVILDFKDSQMILLLSFAAIIVALTIAYYFIKCTHNATSQHLSDQSDETGFKGK